MLQCRYTNLIIYTFPCWLFLQVRFSISLLSMFSRTNTVTNSENFYHSILDLLEDPDESKEVTDLMTWWTQFVASSVSILKLTLVIVRFFQILLHHVKLSAKTAHYRRFGKNVLSCRNELLPTSISLCIFVIVLYYNSMYSSYVKLYVNKIFQFKWDNLLSKLNSVEDQHIDRGLMIWCHSLTHGSSCHQKLSLQCCLIEVTLIGVC